MSASFALLMLLIGVSGCAHQSVQCLVPGQRPMTVSQLFFGRDIAGRAPLTDAEWSAFVSTVIAHEFPDGFTVMDGDGVWRDPATLKIVKERTKILVVASAGTNDLANAGTNDLANRIDRISQLYRSAYAQASVGALGIVYLTQHNEAGQDSVRQADATSFSFGASGPPVLSDSQLEAGARAICELESLSDYGGPESYELVRRVVFAVWEAR